MKNKGAAGSKQKSLDIWRKAIWVAMVLLVVVFVVMGFVFRQSIKQISKDPSLTSLTNESIFRIIQIVNVNKNRGEECWDMMNPLEPCDDTNRLTKGNYELKGTSELKWLEGPIKGRYELSDDFIRDTLAGFMLGDKQYYQTIEIEFPQPDLMQVMVVTENNDGDTSSQLINLNAK